MSTTPRQPSPSRWFGFAAYLGTFLFIPLWDLYALGYALVTGWRARNDPQRGEAALATFVQPLRRLALLALAYVLALVGVGALRGIIYQPGPFGFLVIGVNHLSEIAASSNCCDVSTAIAPQTPVADLIAKSLPQSLWLLGSTSLMGGVLIALLAAVALLLRRLAQRRGSFGQIVQGLLRLGAFRVMAVPAFGIGLVWLMILGVRFGVFPTGGFESFPQPANLFLDHAWHVILPGAIMAWLPALLAAQAAVRVWEDWEEKGRSSAGRLAAMALEAARSFYEQSGWIIGSLIVIEPIFALRGLGKLLLNGIVPLGTNTQQDVAVVIGVMATFPLFLLIARLRTIILASAQRAYLFENPEGRVPAHRARAESGAAPAAGNRRLLNRIWLGVAGLMLLLVLIPIARGLVASPYDPQQGDSQAIYAPRSPQHPLGTDDQGRDVESRILEAQRVSLGLALLGGLAALAVGGAWGGLSAAVRRWRGLYGESLADLIRLPAEALLILHPALVAMTFTVATYIQPTRPGQSQMLSGMALAIGLSLAPRLAWGIESLWESSPSDRPLRWRLGGAVALIYVGAVFAAFQYSEALNFLTLGVQSPLASLGGNLSNVTDLLGGTQAVGDARFYVLATSFASAAGLQGFVLFLIQDALADFFEFRRRSFLPRIFS